jgi:hypothetical protein
VNAHAATKVKKSYKLLNELNEIQCKTPAVIHWCRAVVWVTTTTSSVGLTRSVALRCRYVPGTRFEEDR